MSTVCNTLIVGSLSDYVIEEADALGKTKENSIYVFTEASSVCLVPTSGAFFPPTG
jgi:hypothetical protein